MISLILAAFAGSLATLVLLGLIAAVLALVDRPARESWAPRLIVEDVEVVDDA